MRLDPDRWRTNLEAVLESIRNDEYASGAEMAAAITAAGDNAHVEGDPDPGPVPKQDLLDTVAYVQEIIQTWTLKHPGRFT
jgi:hypothetical protein